MKKCIAVILSLCIILGFLECIQPVMAQEAEKEAKTEALLKYQAEKKTPWIGVGAGLFIPTLGHAYAGDWWFRGAKFLGLYLVSLGLASSEETAPLGLASMWVFRIWELMDAYWAVEDYNKKLADRYGVELSLNFEQERSSSGIRVALSYGF